MNPMIAMQRWRRQCLTAVAVLALAACSSGVPKPTPVDLGVAPTVVSARLAWTYPLGDVTQAERMAVHDGRVLVASSAGRVVALDARSGQALWQAEVGPLAAGVGYDGQRAAVVNRDNDLLVLEAGTVRWRARLSARVLTAPLVAGQRVFVLAADRSLSAYDGASGQRLWRTSQSADALVLQHPGLLGAVGDTLVLGQGGRLVGVAPRDGRTLWEQPIAQVRGTNEIERLVDLLEGWARQGDTVCVRAFQAAVGCVDAVRGTLVWRKAAQGHVGLAGDDTRVFAVESDGVVRAIQRADGAPVWQQDRLRYRSLTAPVVVGRSVAVGDASGQVHLLARSDGALIGRLNTDPSGVVTAPALAGQTLVVLTRNGTVHGFVPE